MPDYRWRWNNYQHPALVAAFDMSTRTPGGLMKNLVQRTGATYDATINGALTLANPLIKCKSTKCMDFDGVNNYLSLANPISGLADYSIVGWVNYDGLSGLFFSRGSAAGTFLYIDGSVGYVLSVLFAQITKPNTKQVINRTYMFAACRRSSDGRGFLFLDGAYYTSGVAAAMPVDANAFIGQLFGGGFRLNGRLDNMLFYNVALDASQISSIYRSANPRV